jgi:hypothetical protein
LVVVSLYKNEPQNSLYQVTTTTSGSSPKTTYFDAFNRTCTFGFIYADDFTNGVFGGGFLMT